MENTDAFYSNGIFIDQTHQSGDVKRALARETPTRESPADA